jgi:hypothetical protein
MDDWFVMSSAITPWPVAAEIFPANCEACFCQSAANANCEKKRTPRQNQRTREDGSIWGMREL